jgi:chitinase
VKAFEAAGVPREKLVLGVPFYGRAWRDVVAEGNGLYQAGKPPADRFEGGYGALAAGVIGKDGFVRCWDSRAQAPYLWNAQRRMFITYDDPESLGLKAQYIKRRGLAGAMFWQYYDDPSGALLGALYTGLERPAPAAGDSHR